MFFSAYFSRFLSFSHSVCSTLNQFAIWPGGLCCYCCWTSKQRPVSRSLIHSHTMWVTFARQSNQSKIRLIVSHSLSLFQCSVVLVTLFWSRALEQSFARTQPTAVAVGERERKRKVQRSKFSKVPKSSSRENKKNQCSLSLFWLWSTVSTTQLKLN